MSASALSISALPLAVTQGDPCGIGPEIIVKAFAQRTQITRHAFVVGDLGVMRRAGSVGPRRR